MNDEELIQKYGLPTDSKFRDYILCAVNNIDHSTDYDVKRCLLSQLFSIGDVRDSLIMWKLKSQSFDSMCSVDIQFLCGAGLDETIHFLKEHESDDAKRALKYLLECVDAGDFEEWSVNIQLGWYREYFELE